MIAGVAVGYDALTGCAAVGIGNIVCQAVLAGAVGGPAGGCTVGFAALAVQVISGITAGDAAGTVVAGRGIATGRAVDGGCTRTGTTGLRRIGSTGLAICGNMRVVGAGGHDALAIRRTVHRNCVLRHVGIAIDDGIIDLDGGWGTFRNAVGFAAGDLCAGVQWVLIGFASAVYTSAVDASRLIAEIQAVITAAAAFGI